MCHLQKNEEEKIQPGLVSPKHFGLVFLLVFIDRTSSLVKVNVAEIPVVFPPIWKMVTHIPVAPTSD